MVAAAIGSLKLTLMLVPTATPDAPAAGLTAVTVGGVVSDPDVELNTTSTQ